MAHGNNYSRYYNFKTPEGTSNSEYPGLDSSVSTIEPGNQQQQQSGYDYKPNFQQYPKKQPSQQQIFYCDICRISCAGPQPYSDHLVGQKHKKKAAAVSLQQKLDGSNVNTRPNVPTATSRQFYCELCDIACGSAESFTAHIRGAKHLKTMNLHTMMGKPVPQVAAAQSKDMSTGAAPAISATAVPPLMPPATTTKAKTQNAAKELNSLQDGSSCNKPGAAVAGDTESINTGSDGQTEISSESGDKELVGQEFIEELRNDIGVIVSFNCRLCECSFTDPNAKRVHLKGRRHRIQYKKKIDASLHVETKPNLRTQKIREERAKKQLAKESYWKMQDTLLGIRLERMQPSCDFGSWLDIRPGPRHNTFDDRLIVKKHLDLYPPEKQMSEIHNAISLFENALKLVSDVIAAEDAEVKKGDSVGLTKSSDDVKTEEMKEPLGGAAENNGIKPLVEAVVEDGEADRMVKGAMRVGLLSKGLMLCNSVPEHLVVVCSARPTRSLLQRIIDHLPGQLATLTPKKYNMETRCEEAGLFVSVDDPPVSFPVTLTSVLVNEDNIPSKDTEDLLSQEHCLAALTLLRQTKWFQVRLNTLKAGTVVAHVLRDFCSRNPAWCPLTDWAQELLVEKCIYAAGVDIGPGEALRSFFECISSGILLPGGHGLIDPCEGVLTDVTSNLTKQQRETITSSAQSCLRMIVFRQMHKVLDIEPYVHSNLKRQREEDDKQEQEKKTKVDDVAEESCVNSGESIIEIL